MANEINEITAALATVRTHFAAICSGTANGERAGMVQHAVAAAILRELTDVFAGLHGVDGAYFPRSLGGPASLAEVKSGYAELSGL